MEAICLDFEDNYMHNVPSFTKAGSPSGVFNLEPYIGNTPDTTPAGPNPVAPGTCDCP